MKKEMKSFRQRVRKRKRKGRNVATTSIFTME